MVVAERGAGVQGGKAWFAEAEKRLARVGRERVLPRLDGWLGVPEGKVVLSAGGSQMPRLLVFQGKLLPREAVIVAVLLAECHQEYRELSLELSGRFAGTNADARRLQEMMDPVSVEAAGEARNATLMAVVAG